MFKNFIQKFQIWKHNLAIYFVTAYAKYLYRRAVERADAMYARNPQMYYVASQVFHPDRLTIYDRDRFKAEKHAFGCATRITTLITLKNGCYYHTPDVAGNQKMSEREKERRRKYFIYERLQAAKLI